ncbi:MAG: flavodoxin domain-containing protein [Usitatibacter sp.]
MARILVVYASIDGHTARVAARVAECLAQSGNAIMLRPVEDASARADDCDAAIVGGAIRYGHHPRALEAWVRANRAALAARPNAFFSVCLSAGGPGAKPAAAQAYIDAFRKRTGWQPQSTASFAGALLYRKYNPFIRLMMRLIVGAAGGDTDTSRDYEYTDWPAVERFATEVAAQPRQAQAA